MELMEGFYKITMYLLPAAGIVLMGFLTAAVAKVIKILKNVDGAVVKVNQSIDEAQKPLATVVKISGGIDAVYDYSEKAMKSLGIKIVEALNYLWRLINGNLNNSSEKEKEEDENAQKEN